MSVNPDVYGLSILSPQSDDLMAGYYDSIGQDSQYQYISGFAALPIAGTGNNPPEVVCVHSPVGLRTVRFGGKKHGSPPVLPAPPVESLDPSLDNRSSGLANDVFLAGQLSAGLPGLDTNYESMNYSVSGSYSFVQKSPPVPGSSGVTTGFHPFYVGDESVGSEVIPPATTPSVNNAYFSTTVYGRYFNPDLIRDSLPVGGGLV